MIKHISDYRLLSQLNMQSDCQTVRHFLKTISKSSWYSIAMVAMVSSDSLLIVSFVTVHPEMFKAIY